MSLTYSGSHPSRKQTALQLRFWAVASLDVRPRNPSEEETFSALDHTVGIASHRRHGNFEEGCLG